MEIKQIQYFECVCKNKSFSKAADELYLTQQAVSKKIKNLEAELNTSLFLREHSGVSLTEEGHYFHEQAAIILHTCRDITDHFSEISNKRKSGLRIGISHGLSIFFSKTYLQEFEQQQPGIALYVLELWNQQTEEDVMNGSIDVGFTLQPIQYAELHTETLFYEPLCCIVNKKHHFANRTSLTVEDILDEEIVMADENYNSYYDFKNVCKEYGKSPKTQPVPDLISIYEHCMQENVVGFSLNALADVMDFRNIVHIPLSDCDAHWGVCMVWNENSRKSKHIEMFAEYVKNSCPYYKRP